MKNKKLNRDRNSRVALFRGQISSLIEKEEITTTKGKAVVLKSLFERLLTKASVGSLHSRRQVQSEIRDNDLVKKIVDDIAPRYKGSKGGYTKVTIVGNRKGDGASMVKIALTKKSLPTSTVKKSSRKEEVGSKSVASVAKVVAPRVAKPTRVAQVSAGKSAIGTKRGER